MLRFTDILYGSIALPTWIEPFLRMPELARLRGVRLSNVDSYQYKDFGGATRWDHCVAVAALAHRVGERRRLGPQDRVRLTLAALLHDVATPPFAHTAEQVLTDFDHELESYRILAGTVAGDAQPTVPVYCSQLPQFTHVCQSLSKRLGFAVDPESVGDLVVGEGPLGFLVSGSIDLDNIDNVVRASMYLGRNTGGDLPLNLTDWLATCDERPVELHELDDPSVKAWLECRHFLYSSFFNCNAQEEGRQALLQHLMRRALRAGLPRHALIWSTDEELLARISTLEDPVAPSNWPSLNELVQRYRLMEPTVRLATVVLDEDDVVRAMADPRALDWFEEWLSSDAVEVFAALQVRRYKATPSERSLIPEPRAVLNAFKLGGDATVRELCTELSGELPQHLEGEQAIQAISGAIGRRLPTWVRTKPWKTTSIAPAANIGQFLDSLGDWSFRLSRNDSLHPYPGTFVHAIPASLLNALGAKGDRVLDPFGGTGQTATEVVRYGGEAISADINRFAMLAARAKLAYLSPSDRRLLRKWAAELDRHEATGVTPDHPDIGRWHHPRTAMELASILASINRMRCPNRQEFCLAAFSAILPNSTARRGKQHGFFADNTPLEKGATAPPYVDAVELLRTRVRRSLDIVERLYAQIERSARDPAVELARARIVNADIRTATPADYGVEPHSVGAVITSPPYLCMADYVLGQRLSYYWLAPDKMDVEFEREVGSRRERFSPEKAERNYFEAMEAFARVCSECVRPSGFVAVVLGQPTARAFKEADVLGRIDELMAGAGFTVLWEKFRTIHWHRQHGYERLRKERISVYQYT